MNLGAELRKMISTALPTNELGQEQRNKKKIRLKFGSPKNNSEIQKMDAQIPPSTAEDGSLFIEIEPPKRLIQVLKSNF